LGGILYLDRWPSLWWDEGWTMSVARNWIEFGHYGQMNAGQPAPPGLSAAFPVVMPLALSFKLFGVGTWQARLPGVLFLLAALGLLYYLGLQLYNQRVALAVLLVLLLMSGIGQLHPLPVGRAVLGEMPMLFYLLAGWTCLLGALTGRTWLLLPAMLMWGLGIDAKSQALPFWLASLVLPLVLAIWKGWIRETLLLIAGMGGGWLAGWSLLSFHRLLVETTAASGGVVGGLYSTTAVVLDAGIRQNALRVVLTLGLPLLVGIIAAAWGSYRSARQVGPADPEMILRLILLGFCASWLAWYLLLSIAWDRYLFPAMFVGGLFIAALLDDLTGGFDWRGAVRHASRLILERDIYADGLRAWLAIILVAVTLPLTVAIMTLAILHHQATAVKQTAAYLNSHVPGDALVETYESELFHLLDVRYHYPPDSVHVQIARRRMFDPDAVSAYNPLDVDPDYLVVGGYSRDSGLYDPLIESGEFTLVQTYPGYEIYARSR